MTGTVAIRELHYYEEFEPLLDLQQTIWQMAPGDCISPLVMRAVTINGGVVLGAEHEGRPVGFCFGFPARRADRWLLWSHAAGVHPDYQRQGIGYRLKQAQRTWARERGYPQIGWTFDPLQRGNANFNFNQLGVTVRTYHVAFYGQMHDGINQGLASDRFEAEWDVSDPPGAASESAASPLEFLLHTDNRGDLRPAESVSWDAPGYAIEIPYEINALKRTDLDRAIQWQTHFRAAVQQALAAGYLVSRFVIQPPRCWYILRRD